MPSPKLKPTHPWKMYARPLPTLDPSLRDAVLLPPAPGAPLWDCPVPLGVYDFLTVKELGALSCASRAFSGWLAPGTVLGDRLFDAHSAQTRTKLVVGLAAVRVKLRLTEAWEASWADFNALLRSVLMFPVVDSAAIMAPLRAPGGAKQGEPRDDAAEAEWNRMQAGAGAAWAGVMATAEQQWAAVTAAGRAQWDAVQAGLRAYFGSHVFGIAWDGVEAWAAAQTAELEKLGAALWAQTSQAARLEGKLLRLGWAAPERWALRRAARGGGGAAGTKARRTLLDEQRAAWERAVETVWADLRTAAKRLCVKIVLQMIDETNDLAATAQHGYQTYTHEWPALGGVAAAADEPPVLEQGQEQEQG